VYFPSITNSCDQKLARSLLSGCGGVKLSSVEVVKVAGSTGSVNDSGLGASRTATYPRFLLNISQRSFVLPPASLLTCTAVSPAVRPRKPSPIFSTRRRLFHAAPAALRRGVVVLMASRAVPCPIDPIA
jgi:hypothetical protein